MKSYISILIPLLLTSSALCSPVPPSDSSSQLCPPDVDIHVILADYIDLFYNQLNFTAAINKYVAENLTQHNPALPNSREAQINAVAALVPNYGPPELQVFMVDDIGHKPAAVNDREGTSDPGTAGYAMTLTRWPGKNSSGTVLTGVTDIYRVSQSGLFVEHWDLIEALPPNSTNPDPF